MSKAGSGVFFPSQESGGEAHEVGPLQPRSLAQLRRNRPSCVLAVCSLIIAQAQLVWVAELHRHDEFRGLSTRPAFVREGDGSSKGVPGRPLCVACQISRENTARPATGFPPPAPELVARFRPAFWTLGFDVSSLMVLPARAPPISL